MMTQRQAGKIVGPRDRLNLQVETVMSHTPPSPVPKLVRGALQDPNRLSAMMDEYGTLLANNT
jgi:hypothetical protein